jgi:hypothetical protein
MDPIKQAVFGSMPIENFADIQTGKIKMSNTNTILLLGGIALSMGFIAFIIYKENQKLKQQMKVVYNME